MTKGGNTRKLYSRLNVPHCDWIYAFIAQTFSERCTLELQQLRVEAAFHLTERNTAHRLACNVGLVGFDHQFDFDSRWILIIQHMQQP